MKKHRTYTIAEAARALGITKQAVHKAIRRKLLDEELETITETITREKTLKVVTEESLKRYRKEVLSPSHQERGKKRDLG